jgi:hypothetical protein
MHLHFVHSKIKAQPKKNERSLTGYLTVKYETETETQTHGNYSWADKF